MVATTGAPRTPRTPKPGDAAERIELLRLRSSPNPVARAIALAACQFLRKLDAAQEVES